VTAAKRSLSLADQDLDWMACWLLHLIRPIIQAVRLSKFVLDHLEEILGDWESFAQTLLPAGKTLNATALRDDAENLLRAIALDMETAQNPTQQALKSKGDRRSLESRTPHKHAHDRYAIGFDLDQLVAEYRALRASVIRRWTSEFGQADHAALEELTRFNEAIDEALADSVARYGAIVERAKTMFLAILGHDLRTPLSAVLSAANGLLLAEDEGNRTLKTAALILRSGQRMSQLVSDLVDFTRTRLGDGLPLVRRPMDIGVAAQEATEETQAVFPENTIRLTRSGDLRGTWDEGRVKQSLTNLIENAAQHATAKTPVTVSASGDGDHVVLTVHNHGTPVPEPDRARIFEPLVQVAETSSPVISTHMGLGLYIVRQIVQAHGGTVDLESTESAGTTFAMKLPRQ
jgi:signal transduction histidine kinase